MFLPACSSHLTYADTDPRYGKPPTANQNAKPTDANDDPGNKHAFPHIHAGAANSHADCNSSATDGYCYANSHACTIDSHAGTDR